MAAPVKVKKPRQPTEAERDALRKLFYDSCLLGCHGIVVSNVQEYLGELLDTLGRPDLAALARDLSQITL